MVNEEKTHGKWNVYKYLLLHCKICISYKEHDVLQMIIEEKIKWIFCAKI